MVKFSYDFVILSINIKHLTDATLKNKLIHRIWQQNNTSRIKNLKVNSIQNVVIIVKEKQEEEKRNI